MNGEPDTARVVSPVRGRVSGNLPQQCGKALGAYPTLYGYRAGAAFHIRRGTKSEYRQELYQKLCRRVPGGGHHRTGLHHLLPVCSLAPCGKSGRFGSNDGVGLYWRIGL